MSVSDFDALLLKEIREVLTKYSRDEEGLFRGLARLQKSWNLPVERFSRLLLQAQMRPQRVSELRVVLQFEDLRDKFVLRASWKKTLELARDRDRSALNRAGARLTRLLNEERQEWPEGQPYKGWTLKRYTGGRYRFEGEPGKLDILPTQLVIGPQTNS